MLAPPGPGRTRASNRGRGSLKAGGRGRDIRNGAKPVSAGRQPSSNALPGCENQRNSRTSKLGQNRNKPWRNSDRQPPTTSDAEKKIYSKSEPWRNPASADPATYKTRMNDLFQTLKEGRERERKQAIQHGFLADPDKPTSLANAITPVGTCQDMCPEFERVERTVQLMVDGSEKEVTETGSKVPCEALMVKRFRRSAAGYDEQLPSDIRPPTVLKKTLDYLINDVVGGTELLATVHKYVWDRTRGIRNDFSIQQVTRTEDLRLAIDCFERIARFHILSLHQLSTSGLVDNEFNHHQEREQLNNTLLSLMYYYDDSRHKLTSPNEAEFRAYCIIFEIQDQRPDLEDRIQTWPRPILKHPRVQNALRLYAAAGNATDEQGPLRPRTPFCIAQANPEGFWAVVKSNAISYLSASVAEIYFNLVRTTALETLWRAYKGKRGGSAKIEDWILSDLTLALGFDNDKQTIAFCEDHGLVIGDNDRGNTFVDFSSVAAGQLSDSNPRRKQIFSKTIVESKRHSRSLPAVINGVSVHQAKTDGLIEENSEAEYLSDANDESLFLDGDSDAEETPNRPRSGSPVINGVNHAAAPKVDPAANPFQPASVFGQSSSKPNPFAPVTQSLSQNTSSTAPQSNPFANKETAKPNPFQISTQQQPETTAFNQQDSTTKKAADFNPFAKQASAPTSDAPKEPPTFSFLSPPRTEAHGMPGLPASRLTSGAFGPSSTTSNNAVPATAAPAFQFSTPQFSSATSATSESTTQPGTNSSDPVLSDKGKDPETTSQSKPMLTFGTSPMFQPKVENKQETIKLNTNALPAVSSAPGFQSSHFSSFTNSSQTSNTAPQNSSKTPSDLFSTSSTPTQHVTGQNLATQTPPTGNNPPPQTLTSSTTSAPKPPSSHLGTFSPGEQKSPIHSETITKPPTTQTSSFQSALTTSTTQPSAQPKQQAQQRRALEALASIMMTEDGGLMQQFVEHTVAPIIKSSVARFHDDKSWARAREYRTYLLAKKFCTKWKSIAWQLGLKRRAMERRQNLARSLREQSQSPSDTTELAKSTFARMLALKNPASAPNSVSDMPPPSASVNKLKRQSLPSELIAEGRSILASAGSKRKREDAEVERCVEMGQTQFRPSHRRNRTLGGSVMSAPPHGNASTSMQRDIEAARSGDGSLLGDILKRQQARRSLACTTSNTTRTDYFKMKVMGLDPSTPLVPETKSQPKALTRDSTTSQSESRRPESPSLASTIARSDSKPQDNDDEFFASIRKVRETLAETTTWFQSERQSIERSMTPQSRATSPRFETPAERRLREIRERGTTPTRTALRHREMADKSLLPNGLWREGVKAKRKQDETSTEMPSRKPMGFAALAGQKPVNGMTNGDIQASNWGQIPSTEEQKGTSAEDAIEL